MPVQVAERCQQAREHMLHNAQYQNVQEGVNVLNGAMTIRLSRISGADAPRRRELTEIDWHPWQTSGSEYLQATQKNQDKTYYNSPRQPAQISAASLAGPAPQAPGNCRQLQLHARGQCEQLS